MVALTQPVVVLTAFPLLAGVMVFGVSGGPLGLKSGLRSAGHGDTVVVSFRNCGSVPGNPAQAEAASASPVLRIPQVKESAMAPFP